MAGYRKRIPELRAQSGAKEYWKKIWFFALLWFGSFWYLEGIIAKAEPVSLQSDSAIIYAGTDEAGDRVGNLLWGSSFELLETVTAEDGSSWYHISTPTADGYIKGDVEIERGQAGNFEPGDNMVQEGTVETTETGNEELTQPGNGEMAQTGNGEPAQNGAGIQNGTTAPEGNDGQTEEAVTDTEETTPGETEGETGISENYADAYRGTNTRDKTYAGGKNSLKNIDVEDIPKDTGDDVTDREPTVTPVRKINRATLFFGAVAVGTVSAALISYGKLRRMFGQSKNTDISFRKSGKNLGNEKTTRKKKKYKKKKGKSRKNGNTKKQQL